MGGKWNAEQQAAVRRVRRGAGLCVRCGKSPRHPDSLSDCGPCVVYQRLKARRRAGCTARAVNGRGRKTIVSPEV